jgi:hypothetical protein
MADSASSLVAHQHGLSAVVKARLAEVVQGLRADWLAGPALRWEQIHPIHEMACTDIDKRVSAALRDAFFGFSQFLCGLEVLLLEIEEGLAGCGQPPLPIEATPMPTEAPRSTVIAALLAAEHDLAFLHGSTASDGCGTWKIDHSRSLAAILDALSAIGVSTDTGRECESCRNRPSRSIGNG